MMDREAQMKSNGRNGKESKCRFRNLVRSLELSGQTMSAFRGLFL